MTDSKPLVFVGVPAYNRPNGLRNTLTALSAQSYQHLEIHVSDDASPNPAVLEVVKEFAKRDSRVKFHHQKQNLGIISNHQFLLTKVPKEAPYVMWACDDDDWHPDYIKVCVEALEKNPEAVLCTTENLWVLKGSLCQMNHSEQVHTLGISDPVNRYKQILSNILWWNHSYYGLIRRDVYQKLPLQRIFAFDILFIAHLSLLGTFIKIQQSYFLKTIGGYGSELKQNLRSVGDKRKLSRYAPRLRFFLDLRSSIKKTDLLKPSQKTQVLISSLKLIAAKSTYDRSVFDRLARIFYKGLNAFRFTRIWLRIKHFRLAWLIHIHRLPTQDFSYSKKERKLYSKKLGLVFKASSSLFGSYYEFLKLKEKHEVSFVYDHGQERNLIMIDDITLELKEGYYSFLLKEIFINEVYRFDISSPSIVIDIGTNVGVAALYFAQKTNVKKVFGFEPFQETAQVANDNFRLNASYSSKIHLENFGLANKEETLNVNYSFKTSQLSSIKKTNHELFKGSESKLTTIQVKKTTEVLEPIIKTYSNEKKVLKVDTEGSEYEIIDDLNKSGLLKKFDYIMIEWHGDKHETLLALLKRNSFKVIVKDRNYSSYFEETGMIYAYRETPNL